MKTLEEIKKEYPEIPLGRAKNLIGQVFGKLHPLYRTNPIGRNTATYWVCQCDCGNIKPIDAASLTAGRSKSCGCLIQDKHQLYVQDMIGKQFNNWIIKAEDINNPRHWIVECSCEKHTQQSMRIEEMKTSKGCKYCSVASNRLVDLTGQKINHWLVLYQAPSQGCHTMWHCQCDCAAHTEKDVDAYKLKNNISTSCGCDKQSKGEKIIAKILQENNIAFEREKIFNTCKTSSNGFGRFDFYVNNSYLIEYDGEQHYNIASSGWNIQEKLERTQERDNIKNQWCKDNNIPLIRIPYTHLKDLTLADLQLETSQFIVS